MTLLLAVPLLVGTWLIGRKPWGFLISVLWTVKGTVYLAVLLRPEGPLGDFE